MSRQPLTKAVLILGLMAVASLFAWIPANAQDDAETMAKKSFNEGISQMQQGNNDLAVTSFRAAIQGDPNFVDAYLNLGVVYYQSRMYDEALEQFQKVVELDKNNIDGFANLGLVQNKLRRRPEAVEAFQAALAIDPNNTMVLKELGKVQYVQKDYNGAIASFEKCHAAGGGDASTYYYEGRSYSRAGDDAKAVAMLREAIKLEPDYYNAHFALGQIFLGQEKYSSAAASFKSALKASPGKAKAAYNYAVAVESENQDNIDANVSNWEAYIRLAKKDPKEKSNLAIAEQHVSDLKERKEKMKFE